MDNALYKKIAEGLAPIVKSVQKIDIWSRVVVSASEYTSAESAANTVPEITDTISINKVNPQKCCFYFTNTNPATTCPRVDVLTSTAIIILPDQSLCSTYISRTENTTYYKGQRQVYQTHLLLIEFY